MSMTVIRRGVDMDRIILESLLTTHTPIDILEPLVRRELRHKVSMTDGSGRDYISNRDLSILLNDHTAMAALDMQRFRKHVNVLDIKRIRQEDDSPEQALRYRS